MSVVILVVLHKRGTQVEFAGNWNFENVHVVTLESLFILAEPEAESEPIKEDGKYKLKYTGGG